MTEYRNPFNDPKNHPMYDEQKGPWCNQYNKNHNVYYFGYWNKWGFLTVCVFVGGILLAIKMTI